MKDRSDWDRVRKLSDAQIRDAVARDPDAVMLDEDWLRRAKVVIPPKKQMVALRLDADVVAWLRDSGKGYQTRINALLRAVMDGRLVPK